MGLADHLKNNTPTPDEVKEEKRRREMEEKEMEINAVLDMLKKQLGYKMQQAGNSGQRVIEGCFYGGNYYSEYGDPVYFAPLEKYPKRSEIGFSNDRMFPGHDVLSDLDIIAPRLKQWLDEEGFESPEVKILSMDIWSAPRKKLFDRWKIIGQERTIYVKVSW